MSGTTRLSYDQLCARLKEMDALVASIRHEEVDALVGEKHIILLNSSRRFEEALRVSREQFRVIYDASPMAIALYDPDGKLIHVNKSCLALFGVADVQDILAFDFMAQKNLAGVMYGDLIEGKPVNCRIRLDFAEAASHGLTNCGKTGTLFLDVFLSPMQRPGEQAVSGYLAKIFDSTAHRRDAEQAAFQAKLLESVNEAVVATDLDGRITYWGKGAERMFGNSDQEMLGRPMGDVFSSVGRFQNLITQCRETGSAASEYEKPLADGKVLWLSAVLSLLQNPDGTPWGMVGILRDITQRKLAEKALKDREKQLEIMYRRLITAQEDERKRLSRELHDSLGQKIVSIQLEVEWLKNRESEAHDKDKFKSMLGLTVDISDEIQHICLGLRPVAMDRIGFNAAVKALLEEFETTSNVTIDASIMSVDENNIDPDTAINLYRILQEALTNAVRHSNTKAVYVSLAQQGSEFILDVRDEGCGMPEDQSSRKLNCGILGMRERANMSSGHFEINSTPGKGTQIRVSVPVGKPVGGKSDD